MFRQHNSQDKKAKRTKNDLQNTTEKTKDGTPSTSLKTKAESYADNCFIFYSVFRYIKRSKRFLII